MVSMREGRLLVWDGAANSRTKKEEKKGAKKENKESVLVRSKEDKGK